MDENKNAPVVNTDFMKEKIKQRPVNKRRLLFRTMVTVFLAILFGAVACTVFFLLSPYLSARLNPPEETKPITFPEETEENELSPEEMFETEKQITEQEVKEQISQQVSQISTDQIKEEVLTDLQENRDSLSEITMQYNALRTVAEDLSASLVTVTGSQTDLDWAGDLYERSGSRSGLIIADTEEEYLILARGESLRRAQKIRVTFGDQTVSEARIIARDSVTEISVLSVRKEGLSESTMGQIRPAVLGSSARRDLVGRPVIAAGSPAGTIGSVGYGIVTNASIVMEVADSTFHRVTTDIYASADASGVLADLSGRVIGWIDLRSNPGDSPNLLSAIGITDLKPVIERLSNRMEIAYLGVYGASVPDYIHREQGVPYGAYITRTEMDSPAMEAGLQSGDIIISADGHDITSYEEFTTFLQQVGAPHTFHITVMRSGLEGYEEIRLEAEAGIRYRISENQ